MAKMTPTIVPANSTRFTVAEHNDPKLKLPIIAWLIDENLLVSPITPEGPVTERYTVLYDDRTLSGKKLKKVVAKVKLAA